MLFVVAALGVGMAALGTLWSTVAKREKEAQLLFVGDQFRLAIESYRQRTPGGLKQYPRSLEDLLEDKRFPMTVRHLRRLWRDPLTGQAVWGLVRDADRITGVHSLAEGAPMKQAGFPSDYAQFEGQSSYQGWVFAARPEEGEGSSTGEGADSAENAAAPGETAALKPAPGARPRRLIRGPVPSPGGSAGRPPG